MYINQIPVLDQKKEAQIFWVGLSAVQFNAEEDKQPLSPFTRSGALIETIEKPFKKDVFFYKTNLVKCLPLKDDKIRYPLSHEMEKCFPNFEFEVEFLKPSLVFLLGKQVASFVIKKVAEKEVFFDNSFNYDTFLVDNILYVPVHHPSYILVYKRKLMNEYIHGIQRIFENILVST